MRGNVDLDVSVVETDGSTTQFTVPSSALNIQGSNRAEGLNLSLGRVRDSGMSQVRHGYLRSLTERC